MAFAFPRQLVDNGHGWIRFISQYSAAVDSKWLIRNLHSGFTDLVRNVSNNFKFQKHFLRILFTPHSEYSSFVTHISWNVDRDDDIDPPIQTVYFLSGGATTWISVEADTNACNSLCNNSVIPGNIVESPHNIMFEDKSP